jgi:hypothetical protein
VAARLAERASTKISIALIIAVGASSRLAALSVNTKTPISTHLGRPEKREHSEEGDDRGASLYHIKNFLAERFTAVGWRNWANVMAGLFNRLLEPR